MKIGLTGSIACGKSTVSAYLRMLGYPVVDADAISHALTAPSGAALSAIRSAFGNGVFDAHGALDRSALGALVFSDPARRKQLNAILHPMILDEIDAQVQALHAQHPLVFADIPLLFECGMERKFDQIWVVAASRDTQIARIIARDALDEVEACRRIDSQMPLAQKTARADAVIFTEGTISDTQSQVRALLSAIHHGATKE